jgi:hypothetical protein
MKSVGVALFLIPFLVSGQVITPITEPEKTIEQFVFEFSEVDGLGEAIPDIAPFIHKLEDNKIRKNSLKFCRTLYNKTRREFFHRYDQYASFRETLSRGTYNCLTGTVLYALLLDHFHIEYSIVETNYHIFLLVSTDEGEVLFETTDPFDGFVSDAAEIEKRIQHYKQNTLLTMEGDDKQYYEYEVNLYKQVSLNQMSGLLHYNLSTHAYNQQNFEAAIHHLDKALDLYSSPRITEFSSIMLMAVNESNFEEGVKTTYQKRIQAIRKKQISLMANRSYGH